MTRLLIPPYPFRVAALDELWLWLAEVEEVAVFFVVEGLGAGTVAGGEVAVFLVVEGLGAGTVAGEEAALMELLKLSRMQLDVVPQ